MVDRWVPFEIEKEAGYDAYGAERAAESRNATIVLTEAPPAGQVPREVMGYFFVGAVEDPAPLGENA